jgi:sigma-B regulation protein RsbU (phosphoserine phosphatase)
MPHRMKRFEAACMGRLRRRPLSGFVERGAFWLLLVFAVLMLLAQLQDAVGDICEVLGFLAGTVLAVLLIILTWRWVFRRLLWTVRNRLILTCLLMGLAPVVLFGTLTGVAAYLFAGQFATHTALQAVNNRLERLRDQSAARVAIVERELPEAAAPPPAKVPNGGKAVRVARLTVHGGSYQVESGLQTQIHTWVDGKLSGPAAKPSASGASATESFPPPDKPVPVWLQPGFAGVVDAEGQFYLCASSAAVHDGHTIVALATAPLNHAQLDDLAQGLGSIFLYRALTDDSSEAEQEKAKKSSQRVSQDSQDGARHHLQQETTHSKSREFGIAVQGGNLGPAKHFFDREVIFPAQMPVSNWQTGKAVDEPVGVASRPTLLYALLFSNSVYIGRIISDLLIAITVFFALLELVALLLALRLGRTMTRSIGELYGATREIDRGNLAHRIPVERNDQLGALATSFNTMTGSLAELLVQQREKERMQGELEIAQEVQNNLFPHTPVHLHGFELHGECRPALTVSGDYYDFILSGEGRLCFALGDISGKGISAALLMASLHSAVRAYHSPHGAQGEAVAWTPEMPLPSPGKLLALLNRHLFLSTQPAKYATLFLACYDSATRQLTYSNGGHLTPFLLRADGRLDRLACGGSVVGLLDGLEYPEATIELYAGDLLIAYSDGLTEPENEFEEFGEERLVALVRQNQHEPLTKLTTDIMRALQQWIGAAEQPDDMTVVLARQL